MCPPQEQSSVTFKMLINGNEVSKTLTDRIARVVVEDDVTLPDLAIVRIDDPTGMVFDTAGIALESELEIRVVTGAQPSGVTIFKGEITAIEIDIDNERKMSVIRGYDLAHRLQRGRTTETYEDQTIGDVVGTIARRHGLRPGKTGDLSWSNEDLVQWNESDWEFLTRLGAVYGHEVLVDHDGKLNFQRPRPANQGPPAGSRDDVGTRQLVRGENLIRIRAGLTAGDLAEKVAVRGWDPWQKREVVAEASTARATVHDTKPNPAAIAAQFNGGTLVRSDLGFSNREPAEAAAQGIVEQLGAVSAELEGTTFGDPELRAGSVISVAGVGKMMDGKHTLTSCRHVLVPNVGYTTEFRSSGTQRRGLLGLTNGDRPRSSSRIGGVVPAIVTDLDDPETMGRVRVSYPWLDDKSVSPWARVLSVGGGNERGIVFMPEVGDEVLVAFHHGDTQLPYILGGLHNGRDRAFDGAGVASGQVKKRTIVSREKHRLELDDEGNRVLLSIGTDDLQIEMSGNETKIVVRSDGKIEITAKGDLSIAAQGKLDMKGQGVSIDAGGGDFEAKGISAKVTASSSLELSGPQSKVSGSGMLELSGGLVKIN
jgi:uncharacterized protein involved in type VI secretion and phage assembly